MTGRTKELYDMLKAHNLCPRCGREPPMKDHVLCWACNANNNDSGKVYYEKHKTTKNRLPEIKVMKDKLHEKRREQGLCFRCGKRPAISNAKYSQCKLCNDYSRRRMAEKRQKQGMIPHILRGDGLYCYHCVKPKCNGERVCDECREKLRKHMLKIRELAPKYDLSYLFK